MSNDNGHNAAELLRLAGNGDQAAWEEIIWRYRGLVLARVRLFRLQDADAHDAVQMTWLRLIENWHRIQLPELLGPWLATTADRECLRILRAATRRTNHDPTMMDTLAADPAEGPEQRAISRDTTRILHDVVAALDPREQTLVRALFSDQPPSYAELAHIVRVPLGSLGPTRARVLRKLRRKLDALHFSAA